MRVDFYRFESGDGVIVAKILGEIAKLDNDQSRTRRIEDVPFRVQQLTKSERYFDGDIVRIRMDDVPPIVGTDGTEAEVQLAANQGIGEKSAFRYDPATQVIAIQANRYGVSVSKLARYLDAMSGHKAPLTPIGVVAAEALSTIERFKEIRKVSIRYAGIKNAKLIVDPQGSTAQGIEALTAVAPSVEISVSMGRKKGSMPAPRTKSWLTKLVKWHANPKDEHPDVKKIAVVGTLDDDTTADLNLLQFMMQKTVKVDPDKTKRRPTYAARAKGISEAWTARVEELEKMFPAAKGK